MNRQKAILIVKNNWPENPNILGEEKIRKWIVRTLKSLNNSSIQIDGAYEMMLPAIAWLEKQGEQKPAEWSEEDKKMFVNIKACLRNANKDYSAELDWLKSLKPQKQWKPTKEQIMALRWVLNHIPYNSNKEEISGLLDQILKL